MKTRSSQAGITLPELLVALAIASLVLTATFAIFRTHHLMAARQEESTLMQQELLAASSQLVEELRMCGYSPTGAPGFGFAHRPGTGAPDFGRVTDGTGVYCRLDLEGDGSADESGEGSSGDHVGFRLNVSDNGTPKHTADNVLRKYDTGAVKWQPLCTNIGDLRFTYFDGKGDVITNPGERGDEIRMIEIRITAIPSEKRQHLHIAARSMVSRVWCRNMAGDMSTNATTANSEEL